MSIFDRFKNNERNLPESISGIDDFSDSIHEVQQANQPQQPDFLNPQKNKFMGAASIFGQRIATDNVAPEPDEPEDASFSDDYYQDDFEDSRTEIAKKARGYFDDIGINLSRTADLESSDVLLRKLAKLKVTGLKFKVDIRTEPFRLGASELFKFLGNNEAAEKVKHSDSLAMKDFEDIIEDVIFLELKERQRAGERIMPTSDDLITQLVMQKVYGMAGEGFENAFDLIGAGIQKAKTQFGKK